MENEGTLHDALQAPSEKHPLSMPEDWHKMKDQQQKEKLLEQKLSLDCSCYTASYHTPIARHTKPAGIDELLPLCNHSFCSLAH